MNATIQILLIKYFAMELYKDQTPEINGKCMPFPKT